MERTESVVIQVAPQYENEKIAEMQMFGWNLHGRQEVHQQGEAYGRPSYLNSGNYVIKTTVHNYVKLHLVRSLTLPNVDQIRQIESEYFNLPFPSPVGFKLPGCFTAFFAFGLLVAAPVMMLGEGVLQGLGALAVYGVFVALGVYWLKNRIKKNKEAQVIRRHSTQRMEQLRAHLSTLT